MTDKPVVNKTVVVTGDVTMDWNLARSRVLPAPSRTWSFDECTRACWHRGGAALLADVIKLATTGMQIKENGQTAPLQVDVHKVAAPYKPVRPTDGDYRHSYAMWSLRPFDAHARTPEIWRVEEFLGHDRCPAPAAPAAYEPAITEAGGASPDLVVIDDAGLGFRDQTRQDLWPPTVKRMDGAEPWFLVKMAVPVAAGDLWKCLRDHHSQRLVVVMSVSDLRRTEVQISRELSWERTALDLYREMLYNARIFQLSSCAHVVVSLGCAGAFLLSRSDHTGGEAESRPRHKAYLFFDPQVIESVWITAHPGYMIGYNTCLTAAIARQILLAGNQPDMHTGIQSGLRAMRALHQKGYGQRPGVQADEVQLKFPWDPVVAELSKDDATFAVVPVPAPKHPQPTDRQASEPTTDEDKWTILEMVYPHDLLPIAEQVAQWGVERALQGVPVARFGKLETVDRGSIEDLRSIRLIIDEYYRRSGQKERRADEQKPLSIAVFGAPGSGKSFTINQVAKSLLPDVIEKLEFNLSQMSSADELRAAFHQVRDAGLKGKLPMVFWDEFDSKLGDQDLGWLRHFLVPMQDGYFLEGQIRHPIGMAIFVFAGGIYESMEQFAAPLDEPDELEASPSEGAHDAGNGDDSANQAGDGKTTPRAFRMAKGPDFISRLKGYVNIQGPNAQGCAEDDPHHVIRRAILLRALLNEAAPLVFHDHGDNNAQGKPQELMIDPGVLRAFLQVDHYRHGARSLEAILNMSLLANERSFQRSSLPARSQLDLHVDGQGFMDLVQRMSFHDALVEELAMATHEAFRRGLRQRQQTNGVLDDWAHLSDDVREQNRAFARDVLSKVQLAGYKVVPADESIPDVVFEDEIVEKLAEMEHIRWMRPKIRNGWRYGPDRDDTKKLHPGLLPWDKVPEEELERVFSLLELAAIGREPLSDEMRNRDSNLVREIPQILREAGYALVNVDEEGEGPENPKQAPNPAGNESTPQE